MAEDLTTTAVVRDCLALLDPTAAPETISSPDALTRLQTILTACLERAPEQQPGLEESQAVAQALARLAPSEDDVMVEHRVRLQRLLAWVEGKVEQP